MTRMEWEERKKKTDAGSGGGVGVEGVLGLAADRHNLHSLTMAEPQALYATDEVCTAAAEMGLR